MNPFTLPAQLTSAFQAAFLAGGTSGGWQPPPEYFRPPIAAVRPPTATPIALSLSAKNTESSEPDSAPLIDRIREHLSYLREVSRGAAGVISPQIARQAAVAWLDCWEATGY